MMSGAAVVDENLVAARTLAGGADEDAGVGRPVGRRLENQLEIAERGVADDKRAEAASRRVLAADDPDAYVRRVLYHERISTWRRRSRLAEHPVGEPPEAAVRGDLADDTVRRVVLERALAKLTLKQRAVIVLRYFEDLSEVDTADALGCSVGTVKSQTSHALGRLRALAPELADLVKDPTEVGTWKG